MNLHYKKAAALLMTAVLGIAALTGCGQKKLTGKRSVSVLSALSHTMKQP